MAVADRHRKLRFAVFEVDLEARELRKRGVRLRLPHQTFQVLEALLERPGQVVTREELRRSLWPADTYVEFDHGLNNAISRLRDVLADSPRNPQFIETIPRLGYRLIVAVEQMPSSIVKGPSSGVDPPADRLPAVADQAKAGRPAMNVEQRRWLVPVLVLALLVVVGAAMTLPGFARAPRQPKSLAVLPLSYVGPAETGDAYLADGMTAALISELSKLGAVRIISETSSRRFAGTRQSLPEIARELGVDAIVEGSVQREGAAVRVSVRLVGAESDSPLWGDHYIRGLNSILALQNEVAEAIALGIGERFSPEDRRRSVSEGRIDPDAYRLYVMGAQLRRKGIEEELHEAVDHYQRAIAIEPRFARAYVGLAEAWIALGGWTGSVPPREGFPKARTAAVKALEIDPNLSEAHVALAFVTEAHDWNLPAAEKLYLRAIELSPNDALAHDRYAQHLNRTGRQAEGVQAVQRAFELNPLSVEHLINLGGRLVDSRRFDDGLAILRKAIDLEPSNFEPWSHIAENYSRAGRPDEAIAAGKRGVELSRQSPHAIQMLATIYARNRRMPEAAALLETLEAASPKRNPHTVAMLHLQLGHADQALLWLETACRERTPQMAFFQFQQRGAQFNLVRNDPRFERLTRCGQAGESPQ